MNEDRRSEEDGTRVTRERVQGDVVCRTRRKSYIDRERKK